ncbi:vWA domain-containing protein [Dendrosporobacter sp. 1207_IL3150]|uniref:vWA domain-containing protein n=1 Tax=Dendrosporobacter sp. 1207_IL3150 TaxID=3084054 RepID=UPI002FDAE9CC
MMINIDYTVIPPDRVISPTEQLISAFNSNQGCRVGECTVASRKMHIYNVQNPGEIQILKNVDAGRLFYNKSDCDKIVHLDIFHECGPVDHRLVAAAITDSIIHFNSTITGSEQVNSNLIDIQTSTGGGRITGNLTFGQKRSLQQAHQNHVHVAAMLLDNSLSSIFYITLAVEAAILQCGLELRRIDTITPLFSSGEQLMDLSDFTDQNDSLLKESEPDLNPVISQQTSDITSNDEQTYAISNAKQNSGLSKINAQKNSVEGSCNQQCLLSLGDNNSASILQYLTYKNTNPNLAYKHLSNIERHIRRLLKNFFKGNISTSRRYSTYASSGTLQTISKLSSNDYSSGILDISATVQAAAVRTISANNTSLAISCGDLNFKKLIPSKKIDICFILDASASMEGPRIQIAKALILRLLNTTAARISLISFQDNEAVVKTTLTRSKEKIKIGLASINPYGATPLALGLKTCLTHLKENKASNPLLVLITDGLPSYASGITDDPLNDALKIADEIRSSNYKFTCIGLDSSQDYLSTLAYIAGGCVYYCK